MHFTTKQRDSKIDKKPTIVCSCCSAESSPKIHRNYSLLSRRFLHTNNPTLFRFTHAHNIAQLDIFHELQLHFFLIHVYGWVVVVWGLCEMVLVQTEGQHGRHSDMVYVSNHTREQCGGNWLLWQLSASYVRRVSGKFSRKRVFEDDMRLLSLYRGHVGNKYYETREPCVFVLSRLVRGKSHV